MASITLGLKCSDQVKRVVASQGQSGFLFPLTMVIARTNSMKSYY